LRNKAKADKSDIMIDVTKKIDEEIAPVVKRLEKHEETINKLITKQEVIHTKVDNILDGQERLMDFMIKISDKLDTKRDK
jgi:Mg2+ and Co2+ transporter CorA